MEEVTSTAQIAICAPSNRSRTVSRRPTEPVDPDFDDLIRIGAKHLLDGNRAEEKSADYTQEQCDSINGCVWIHRLTDWVLGKRLPHGQPAQKPYAAPKSGSASHE